MAILDWSSDEEDAAAAESVSDSNAVDSPPPLPRGPDEAGPSRPSLIPHFVDMGFPERLVVRAVKDNEEGDPNAILQTLLNYRDSERGNSECEASPTPVWTSPEDDDFSDIQGLGETQDFVDDFTKRDEKLALLVEMGFPAPAASSAISKCGEDASILELTDFIYAADMADKTDDILPVSPMMSPTEAESCIVDCHIGKKRRRLAEKIKHIKTPVPNWEEEHSSERCLLPNPMIGFGLPGESLTVCERKIPEMAKGPPFFYYENVALAPTGVWKRISSYLFEIEPEYVDSKFFCATARKRGYVHNLPIKNRFPILPIPAKTIKDALPWTEKWRPKWDQRIHFNCLQTVVASAKNAERIRKALSDCSDPPPTNVQDYVRGELRQWNLVWVGRHKVAPLEPDEMEMLLGYPKHHTRGISKTERYRSLGNSFQIDTVAYHLSVLKDMFPDGMRVLSLFSGIGGAEIALHRLGIRLKVVVSVEICQSSHNILRSWWESNQSGTLIHIDDVQKVNTHMLEELCNRFGGFDLVIGGSPCNNLTGSNRYTRDGLEGHYLAIQKCKSGFNVEEDGITHLTIWVRISGLLVEWFDPQMMLKIGDLLGSTH